MVTGLLDTVRFAVNVAVGVVSFVSVVINASKGGRMM